MSKRYGRTQKRKNREQIKKLQNDLEWFKKSRSEWIKLCNKKQAQLEQITDIIEKVSKMSICLPPKVIAGNPEIDSIRIPLWAQSFELPTTSEPVGNTSFQTLDVHALRVFVEENRQALQLMVHLRYGYEKESVYCLSKESLSFLSPALIAEEISKDIAIELIKHIQS